MGLSVRQAEAGKGLVEEERPRVSMSLVPPVVEAQPIQMVIVLLFVSKVF